MWDDNNPLESLPDTPYERALSLLNGLRNAATGGSLDHQIYVTLRSEFMADPLTKSKLPQFVRTCRDTGEFWEFIKHEFATYAERRDFLRNEFQDILSYLEEGRSPNEEKTSEVLTSFDKDSVHSIWVKANGRVDQDPEGAITSARTLLEAVCKHILDENDDPELKYGNGDSLPKLYNQAAKALNLAPSQHSAEAFRRILGGASSVVEGLGTLRNQIGDAHGQGKRQVRPKSRHASLAVNMAGTMATFLIETMLENKEN